MKHKKIINTEKKIKSAFIYLVNEKGLTHISIKDITEIAQINRSTFYKHFTDKIDLVNHYENEFLKQINKTLNHGLGNLPYKYNKSKTSSLEIKMRLYSIISEIIEYIYDEIELIKSLIGPNGDPYFEEKIKDLLNHILNSDLDIIKGNHLLEKYIPDDYAHEIIISELLNIIKLWLSKSNPEPPQKISEIIMRTRYLSPHDILGIRKF